METLSTNPTQYLFRFFGEYIKLAKRILKIQFHEKWGALDLIPTPVPDGENVLALKLQI